MDRIVQPRRSMVLAAFAAVYLIWGSTYLFIRYAIDTLPPLLMAGTRFIAAAGLLWLFTGKGATRPTRRDWTWAFILGGLLMLVGNGVVTLAEQEVPTGITALLITSVPLWMALLDWLRPGGTRPTLLVAAGLVLGFTGVAVLATAKQGWSDGHVNTFYVVALLLGTLGWATGSLLSRGNRIRQPILRGVAMQMLAGGILLCIVGLLRGEASTVDVAGFSTLSMLSWLYLVTFGSVVAFSAYVWLLKVQPAALVSTYAFVNPIVAVALGWIFLNEQLGPNTLVGAVLIVAAVGLVTFAKLRSQPKPPAPAPTS